MGLLEIARSLIDERRVEDAVVLTDLLWQSDSQHALLHASCLMELRQFDSALHVMDGHHGPEFLFSKMRCSFELGDTKQCAVMAEKMLVVGDTPQRVAARCFLGKCSEVTGDINKAVAHFKDALNQDPFCCSAMNALIDHRLLQPNELLSLIDSLTLPTDAESLRLLYRARIDKNFKDPRTPSSASILQQAALEHERNNLRNASALTREVLQVTPYNKDALCQHLSVLVDMKATSTLFEKAHALSKNRSRGSLAVYAIGCYYFSLSNFERAGRYFSKATELDPSFAEAWVAFGHCYAKLEEGEQALAVYRRTLNAFPGLQCCATFVGMQYSRIHSWKLAMCFLENAQRMSPNDPLVLNEIAVLCVRSNQRNHALAFLQKAVEQISLDNPSEYRDCILFNIATVFRKQRDFESAAHYYNLYVKCRPNASHGHCALGFTYHLMGNLKAAIAHYHAAMSIKVDAFCRDMLDRALAAEFGSASFAWGGGKAVSPASTGDISFRSDLPLGSNDRNDSETDSQSPHPFSVGRSLHF